MKSVLISIQPYWVFLIIAKTMGWNINKEKTVEVRKTYPKDENWDKIAKIYCSKDKKSFARIPKEYQPFMKQFLGKVIGEFMCDEIKTERPKSLYASHKTVINCCVSIQEIIDYADEKNFLYFWHISNLVIYETPLEINDFVTEGDCTCEKCKECKYFERGNGYNVESDCLLPYQHNFKTVKPLFRPPQSWCYVESEVDTE